MAPRIAGVSASADAAGRELLTLLLGLDLALLLLHLGTEAALAASGARFGAAVPVSADRALLGAAAPLQLLAFSAVVLAARAAGPPERLAAAAAAALALVDAAGLVARLARPAAAATGGLLTLPAAKLAVAAAVAAPIVALLLLRSGSPGPLGRAILRLTLGLGVVTLVSELAGLLLPRGAASRSVLDGLEEFGEAAMASGALAAAYRWAVNGRALTIPIRD